MTDEIIKTEEAPVIVEEAPVVIEEKIEYDSVGRPTVITESVLRKLDDCFSIGATDREACFIANIAQSTLYKYQTEHPEYIERKEALKDMLKYKARNNVAKSIDIGDDKTSQWYLERKAKNEFAQRTELSGGEDALPISLIIKQKDDSQSTSSDVSSKSGN